METREQKEEMMVNASLHIYSGIRSARTFWVKAFKAYGVAYSYSSVADKVGTDMNSASFHFMTTPETLKMLEEVLSHFGHDAEFFIF